jgi:hypothetical protein
MHQREVGGGQLHGVKREHYEIAKGMLLPSAVEDALVPDVASPNGVGWAEPVTSAEKERGMLGGAECMGMPSLRALGGRQWAAARVLRGCTGWEIRELLRMSTLTAGRARWVALVGSRVGVEGRRAVVWCVGMACGR